jgi:hypothetical protein
MAGKEGHGVVHVAWYATVLRGDKFEAALAEIAPIALRYGATAYSVFRGRDDSYRFLQTASFDDRLDWERYWAGPEFVDFRANTSSWYQVPVVPYWTDLVVSGALEAELTPDATA